MEIRLTLRPGMAGTKKLLARYGERLLCVRYRYDSATGRRVKTAELIVQDIAWAGRARANRAATTMISSAFVSAGTRASCAQRSSAPAVSGGRDNGYGNSPGTQSALWACTAGSSKNLPGQSGTRIYSGIWCYIPVDVCIYRYMVLGCAGSDSLLVSRH